MIKRSGDLFSTAQICIGHGVNTQGQMGAGVAKIFKDRFPKNYEVYKRACQNDNLRPGETWTVEEGNSIIFNIASQKDTGPTARYDWLFHAALGAALDAQDLGHHCIAIPMIGCEIGGLEWEPVETLLRAIEILTPGFEWEVWKL